MMHCMKRNGLEEGLGQTTGLGSVCPLLQLVITDDFKYGQAGYEAPIGKVRKLCNQLHSIHAPYLRMPLSLRFEIPVAVSGQSTVKPVIEVDASSMVELCWEVQAHNELILAVRDRQSERGNLLIGFLIVTASDGSVAQLLLLCGSTYGVTWQPSSYWYLYRYLLMS